jgi:hypothetical protein
MQDMQIGHSMDDAGSVPDLPGPEASRAHSRYRAGFRIV